MYTTIDEARDELLRRQRDPQLQQRVADFLGGLLPDGFPIATAPVAMLNRYIATARDEDHAFAAMAVAHGFSPWWGEHPDDHFVSNNPDKVMLCRPRIQLPKQQIQQKWIVDAPTQLHGVPLRKITTHDDMAMGQMSLTGFHHLLRTAVFPLPLATRIIDDSQWLHTQAHRFGWMPTDDLMGSMDQAYYPALFARYICHGVLFEDFHGGPNVKKLDAFRDNVVHPALEQVTRAIGVSPLIVHFPWRQGYDLFPAVTATLSTRRHQTPTQGAPAMEL